MKEKNLNSKELNKKEKRLKELKKLKKIFKNIDKNKKETVEKLVESAAFMAVELQELEEYISEYGVTEEYCNGQNQYGTKKSSKVEVYNTMIKNYSSIIKQLCDLVPGELLPTTDKGNALLAFAFKPKGK